MVETKTTDNSAPPAGSSIEDFLHQLVVSQRQESQAWQSQLTSFESRKDIFRGFQATTIFRRMYQEAFRYHLLPRNDQQLNSFRDRLAGALFQGAALIYYALALPQSQLMLFSDKTLDLYQKLYPNSPRREEPLGQTSLVGISVPDSIIIDTSQEKEQILALCECTLSGDSNYYDRHYQGSIMDRKRFPALFVSTHLVFITPKNPYLPLHIEKDREVKAVELSFSREQFRDYIDSVYKFYRVDQDMPTLVEVQQCATLQFKRAQSYLENSGTGHLTRESG